MEPLPRRALPATGEVILEVRGVTKRFGGLVANNDISFDVHAGEILAVIGPNGAGKSTLFNQLSCVDRPTSGEIRFRGRRIDGRTARAMAGAGLSRTFQHVKLLPTMSVLENAAIGAHLRGGKGVAAAALRLDRREEARLLAGSWSASASASICTRRPAASRSASSASWRSPARCAPTPACCCSTSRRPACATWRSRRSPSF